MSTRLETTLWVDTPAFQPWMLPTVIAWADEQTYPNYVHHITEADRASAVKTLQSPPTNPGSTAYVLTSVPHRRYWSCLPPWVHVLARNAGNSPPLCVPEAWTYHWLGGRPWASAKQWVGNPPKSKPLVAIAAEALQAWEDLPPWDGVRESLAPPLALDYEMVRDLPGTLNDYLGLVVGCDIETTGLSPYRDRVLGVSISVREGQGWWIPFQEESNDGLGNSSERVAGRSREVAVTSPRERSPSQPSHAKTGGGQQTSGILGADGRNMDSEQPLTTCGTMNQKPRTESKGEEGNNRGNSTVSNPPIFQHPPAKCPPVLRAVLESPAVAKITHNGGFDWNFLDLHGVRMSPPAGDSKVLAYLLGLWPVSGKLTLKELGSRLLRRPVITYGDATGDEDTLATVDPEMVTVYAAQDSDLTRCLWLFLTDRTEKV